MICQTIAEGLWLSYAKSSGAKNAQLSRNDTRTDARTAMAPNLTPTTPGNFFGSLSNEVSEDDLLRWTKDIPYPAIPCDESSHIRLVQLKPGRRNEDVSVQIVPVPFNEAPTYEAISYAWGEVNVTEPVSVNGVKCRIPVNLLAFFRQRQSMPDQSPLWIDALCIDQTNPADKKAQILHMAKIYCRCTQFTIWLGEESETSALAVNALTRIGKMERVDHFFELKGRARSAIIEFLNRSWWTRVWIVQEVAMAADPGVARILCGKRELRWLTMARAAFHLKDIADFHTDADMDVNPLLELTLTLESARHRHNDTNIIDGPTLLDLLVQNRDRKASDPRDKVFALLGLLRNHEWQVQIQPDYHISWAELYRKVVVAEVQTTWSLNVLRYCNPPRDIGLDESSWAPDWSRVSRRRLLKGPPEHRKYCAAADFVADEAFFLGRTLTTKGLLIDTIRSSFPLPQVGYLDVLSQIGLLKAISECKVSLLASNFREDTSPYGDADAQCEALWRTIFLDRFKACSDYGLRGSASNQSASRRGSMEPVPADWRPQLPKRESSKSSHVRAFSIGNVSHTSHHDWLPHTSEGWRARDPKRWPRWTLECDKKAISAAMLQVDSPFDLTSHPFNFFVPDMYQHRRAKNEDVQSYHAFFKEDEKDILSYHIDRALFITEKGYVGLGPDRCKALDFVAVIAGADVPFVMESRAVSKKDAFCLIGEAYVHGAMHGEAVRSIEEGKDAWKHIVLR